MAMFKKKSQLLKTLYFDYMPLFGLPPIFKRGGQWLLITSLGGVEVWKIKKGSESMVQGQVFLKEWGYHFHI